MNHDAGTKSSAIGALVTILLGLLVGCTTESPDEVVVYCALDREFSEPILSDYEQQTGITVHPKYDVESTKTVGLANAIIAERNRPRCDLFWNNEILHTLRLKRLGLLDVFQPSEPAAWPEAFQDPKGKWYGFAARARVLLVNTKLLPDEAEWPNSVEDLISLRFQGKTGIAKPLFGTTATHAAVLFAKRGEEEAVEFFGDIKQHCQVLGGNKQVAQAVSSGQILFGLTDTDDALIELEAGRPVKIVFPDQDGEGTLLIPNTLCLIKGGPNPEAARKLAEKIVSAETERRLANAESAQIPLHRDVDLRPRVLPKGEVKWMGVDFEAAAEQWENASAKLKQLFAD